MGPLFFKGAPPPKPHRSRTMDSILFLRSDIKTQYHLELTPSGETRLTVRQEKDKVLTDTGETLEGSYFVESTHFLDFASTMRLCHTLTKAKCSVISLD